MPVATSSRAMCRRDVDFHHPVVTAFHEMIHSGNAQLVRTYHAARPNDVSECYVVMPGELALEPAGS